MRTKHYRFGLIGFPVSYSLSPCIHKAAMESVGIEGEYNLISTPPNQISDTLDKLYQEEYIGFNVSLPYRVNITYMLPEVKEMVGYSGSVSSVKILKDGKMVGYNTEVYSFASILPCDVLGKKAAILGTGGISRSICVALIKMGIRSIDVYSRDPDRAANFFMLMEGLLKNIECKVCSYKETERFSNVSLLINATPVGLKDYSEGCSILNSKDLNKLPKDAIVYDVVYNPSETVFLRKAKEIGYRTFNGLDMLIHQAAKTFSIWTEKDPDIEYMKQSALKELEA